MSLSLSQLVKLIELSQELNSTQLSWFLSIQLNTVTQSELSWATWTWQ